MRVGFVCEEKQARRHGRLIRALRPARRDSTYVGDAVRRAAADLGIEADGRGFEPLAEMVMAAARGGGWGARGGRPWVRDQQSPPTRPTQAVIRGLRSQLLGDGRAGCLRLTGIDRG